MLLRKKASEAEKVKSYSHETPKMGLTVLERCNPLILIGRNVNYTATTYILLCDNKKSKSKVTVI